MHITIVGAGLAGSLLAIYLGRKGYRVHVYERRADMRKVDVSAGRSINLALSDRGWRALEEVDMKATINEIATPMKGRMIHQDDGHLDFQPYGQEGQAIYSVSRGLLNQYLMDAAEATRNVTLYFNQQCEDINLDQTAVTFRDNNTGREQTIDTDIILGTDGAFSAVRQRLMKTDRFNYSQSFLEHGYKELSIPAAHDSSHLLEKNALHIWPRNSFMLIALPNLDGSFTSTLFLPFEGGPSFEQLRDENDVASFFQNHFPDAYEVMPTLKDDFFNNPTSSLVTIRCYPWSFAGNAAIMGDAAHAVVPFYGQGMNAGFEDVRLFNHYLEEEGDWEAAFHTFEREHKPDADAIADLALENFIEMRDKVADPQFLLRKKLEKKLEKRFPDQFQSVYAMVTFSHQPYSKALEMQQYQDRLFNELVSTPGVEEKVDNGALDERISKWLEG